MPKTHCNWSQICVPVGSREFRLLPSTAIASMRKLWFVLVAVNQQAVCRAGLMMRARPKTILNYIPERLEPRRAQSIEIAKLSAVPICPTVGFKKGGSARPPFLVAARAID